MTSRFKARRPRPAGVLVNTTPLMPFRLTSYILLLFVVTATATADEAGYGDLAGQFLLDGTPPKPEEIKPAAICAGARTFAEDLLVDPKTGGIANVFVFLSSKDAEKLALPPDLKVSAVRERVFDQDGCVFVPHAMVVRRDQTVRLKSNDPMTHNVHTFPLRNPAVNLIVSPNDRTGVVVRFNDSEAAPIPVKCDIHPWMQAHWLIVDHPYAAVTDGQGRFRIERLPQGTHSFRIWHERSGFLDRDWKVTIASGKTTDATPIRVPLEKLRPRIE